MTWLGPHLLSTPPTFSLSLKTHVNQRIWKKPCDGLVHICSLDRMPDKTRQANKDGSRDGETKKLLTRPFFNIFFYTFFNHFLSQKQRKLKHICCSCCHSESTSDMVSCFTLMHLSMTALFQSHKSSSKRSISSGQPSYSLAVLSHFCCHSDRLHSLPPPCSVAKMCETCYQHKDDFFVCAFPRRA